MRDNNDGAGLTATYLKSKKFSRDEVEDRDGDKYVVWIKNGISIYYMKPRYYYATYIKGDGSFKGGWEIKTEAQLDNLYYSLSGLQL